MPSNEHWADCPGGRNALVLASPSTLSVKGRLGTLLAILYFEWKDAQTCHSLHASSLRSDLCRTCRAFLQAFSAPPTFSSRHSSLIGSFRRSGGWGMKTTPSGVSCSFFTCALPYEGPGTLTIWMGPYSDCTWLPTRLSLSLYVTLIPPW